MTAGRSRRPHAPSRPPEVAPAEVAYLHDLALQFAAGYVRLLASRGNDASPQNPLDVAADNEAPLSERPSRRTKLA